MSAPDIVRDVLFGQSDGGRAVGGGADDLDAVQMFEDGDQPVADGGLIVGDHNLHAGSSARRVQPPPSGPALDSLIGA
jgi:hypothetical protein